MPVLRYAVNVLIVKMSMVVNRQYHFDFAAFLGKGLKQLSLNTFTRREAAWPSG